MKAALAIVALIVALYFLSDVFRDDVYVGFYYPDAGNLYNDIRSPAFESLEACRDWVDAQRLTHNQDGSAYDYECGLNCDFSGGKPYICEDTLE